MRSVSARDDGIPARRVVVAGLGMHGPLGDLSSHVEAFSRGESAVSSGGPPRATGFPPFAIAPADLSLIQQTPSDRKLHKYMSPATQLAVIGAGRALEHAKLLGDVEALGDLALYMTTGLIAFDFSVVGRLLATATGIDGRIDMRFVGEQGLRLIHPLMPFKMLLNMPLGLVSIVYGIKGDNVILYPRSHQAGAALEVATRGVAQGRFDRALVGGAEQGVATMPLAVMRRRGRLAELPEQAWPFDDRHNGLAACDLSAFLVLESLESARAREAQIYAEISVPPSQAATVNPPGRVLATGSINRHSDRLIQQQIAELWPEDSPIVASYDGLLGHASSASLFAHLIFGSHLLNSAERGEHSADIAVMSFEPTGTCVSQVRLAPPPSALPKEKVHLSARTVVRSEQRRVVVTGIGVVSPIGVGREAFFQGLAAARSGIGTIRSFDATTFPTRIAGEVKGLDARAVSFPEELIPALLRDPKSVFGVVAAREALTNAFGEEIEIPYTPQRRSLFLAAGLEILKLDDLASCLHEGDLNHHLLLKKVLDGPLESCVQIPADLGARVIASELGAMGLYSLDVSACAAGTQSLGQAFRALADGACDVALAGGYDSMINPLGVGGFCMLEALSRSNDRGRRASRPFDSSRDGFVLGEGAAMVVFEERNAALERGAHIYAEILGYGSSLDAYRVSDPAPDQAGATQAIQAALDSGGLGPEDLDYINAHGTGTRKNDPAEAKAIRAVLGLEADRVPVSSTKSQIGHLIGASGAVEFCAGIFALQKQLLPATINLQNPDPSCDLHHVALQPRAASVRTFLSTSFGFGGQNAVIVAGRDDWRRM